jgi:RNA polymerase sigma-70 factor (ECF subfamily)
MNEANPFLDLIQRVRAGEEEATVELVQRYEPAIRRAVRIRLRDSRLRRLLDSMDICQSVLASFFVRAASGQYELHRPEQLLKLLVIMARNKLASEARKPAVVRRQEQPFGGPQAAEGALLDRAPSPSQWATGRDLLQEVRRQLSEDERQLADRRAQGEEWAEIADRLGGSPEALRKKLSRALDRVARDLKLAE